MPQRVPTSFVPKQPVRPVRRPSVQGPLDIFAVAALVLLSASLILSGMAFGYKWYLEREKGQKTEQIRTLQHTVDRLGVEELGRLAQRLVIAQELLAGHIAPSALFSLLERDTVQGVQFTEFAMEVAPSGDVDIILEGRARSVNTLAYQSQLFGRNPFIRNQIFSDIDTLETGLVSFAFSGTVSRNLVRAMAGVSTEAPAPPAPVEEEEVEEAEEGESQTI